MFVENNEYDIRKQICESLNKKYNIHDFKWANQSDYMSLYSFYVEQLHYNNNGQLDAFIDHEVICLLKIMNMIFVNRFVSHYIKNTIFTISNGQINHIHLWQILCSKLWLVICPNQIITMVPETF